VKCSRRVYRWLRRYAVLCVAAAALVVSITTAIFQMQNWRLQQENDHRQRLHDEISVAPAIQLVASAVPSNWFTGIGLSLINHGGGAALMQEINIVVEGALAESMEAIVWMLQSALAETRDPEEQISIYFSESGFDILPPGGEQMLLAFPEESWTPERGEILTAFFARMTFNVSYESIYGKRETKVFTPFRSTDSTEASE